VDKTVRPTGAVIEREAKLVVPAGVELPDMTGLVPSATAIELPELRLDATYYDTDDLRLARSGITLRRRDGEPGPAWTVKLPFDVGGPVLARREIRFDGPVGEVPDAAADLVLASARTRDLEPVAHLTTIRRPIEIRDLDGRLLAEVVDDMVSVSGGRCPAGRFREVEIELRDPGDRSRQILDAAVLRFVAAGCITGSPMPKVIRALGKPATRPPDLVATPLAPDATLVGVVRHAVASSVAQIIRHDPGVRLGGDPEDVHHLRVGARRLRSDLRSFAPLLGRDQIAQLRAELGWLGTVVGAVRDHDVLAAQLAAHIASLPEVDAPAGAQLMRRLEDEAEDARAAMLGALRGNRYLGLLEALVHFAPELQVAEVPGLSFRSDAQLASNIARKPWRRLAEAVDALGPDPSDAELHQVRILAKRCRYAAEAVAPIVGPAASRFAAAVAEVQTVLGDHQDTVVAESWLRHAAAAVRSSGLAAGQLVALERSQRSELRAQWLDIWRAASSKKLRHWLRG
jgi:CHAD domain-containing protein